MINGLALCAGGYGLEAGLHLVMPGIYRTVCAVERQAYPVACLVSLMEKKGISPFPVWDDVVTFDSRPWRGIVHVVTAGYPCQPWSCAGKKLGKDDPRHLWPHIRRHIQCLIPQYVFCENVARHLFEGFFEVKTDLEEDGYNVAAGIFSAAEVGAPHLRERLFFLARHETSVFSNARGGPDSSGAEPSGRAPGADPCRRGTGAALAHNNGSELGNPCRAGLERAGQGSAASDGRLHWPWPATRGAEQFAWEKPRIVESGVGGTTHGMAPGNEQLHMLGNGVVPVVAAMAFVALWSRLSAI